MDCSSVKESARIIGIKSNQLLVSMTLGILINSSIQDQMTVRQNLDF